MAYTKTVWTTGDVVTQAKARNWEDGIEAAHVRIITSKSGTYNPALVTDDVIIATANSFTITLYAASGNAGRVLTIKNAGTGVITVDANASETIDGATTLVLFSQYEWVALVCDGTNWQVLDSSPIATPRCSAYQSTAQQWVSTPAVAALDAEHFDVPAGMHDTVTANSKITIPTGGGGVYRITGSLTALQDAAAANGDFAITIRVNGTNIAVGTAPQAVASISATRHCNAVTTLAAGDYVELYGDPGGSFTSTSRLSMPRAVLTVQRISR